MEEAPAVALVGLEVIALGPFVPGVDEYQGTRRLSGLEPLDHS